MRYAALDYGTKYYGLAISDDLGKYAVAIDAVITRNQQTAIYKLLEVLEARKIEHLVIGMPLGNDQKPTQISHMVLAFIEALKLHTNIAISTWNEAMTSRAAAQNVKGKKIHSEAARIMLQEFLDHTALNEAIL
jgi:putative Holliday junction resolvase